MKLLVIDDDQSIGDIVKETIESLGFECVTLSNSKEITQLDISDYSLLITDVLMPDMDGIEILQYLKTCNADIPVILMSGDINGVLKTCTVLAEKMQLRIVSILEKPFRIQELKTLIVNTSTQCEYTSVA